MTAIQLGPLILSTPRFAALLGLLVFLGAAHLLERRGRAGLSDWAWTAALLVVLGSRIGFVLENLGVYLQEPLTTLYFWQGGFSPLWGFVLALAYSLWRTPWRAELLRPMGTLAMLGLATWGGTQLLLTPTDAVPVQRPDTPLQTLAGEPTDIAAIAAGRPAVLNLWAPWCPPCVRETPMIVGVAASHPETAVVLADQGSSPAEVEAFLRERGLSSEDVYLDARARLGPELKALGLPTTLFFAADGGLAHTHVGEISRAELERRMRLLHE